MMYNTFMDKIKKNQQHKVKILDMTHEGTGIAKIDGFPVFVSNTLTGELLDIHIIKANNKYAVAKPLKFYQKSKKRTEPFCDVFHRCGGCDLQHIKYEEQLIIKKQIVESNLQRIGGFNDLLVDEIIGMEKPYNYRNKAQYPVNEGKIGFYAKKSHTIIEHDKCLVQDERVTKIIEYFKNQEISHIKHLVFRIGDDKLMLIVVSNNRKPFFDIELLIATFPFITTIVLNYHPNETNVVLGKENITLYGDGYITDQLLEISYRISPNSFYQVNKVQTEKLYKKVIEFAGDTKNKTIFDLYCGIGTISLTMAKDAKKVIGIESVIEAVNDANINMKENSIDNCEFICNKVEDEIINLYNDNIIADIVIVDPPRKGCDRVLLDTIIKMNIEKMIYVSCDSATLARDLKILCDENYKVLNIVAIDMFPHTKHVETVTLLELK